MIAVDLRRTLLALIPVGLWAIGGAASAQPTPKTLAATLAAITQAAGAAVRTTTSPQTGLVTFLTTEPGHPVELGLPAAIGAEARARAFLALGGAAFGVASPTHTRLVRTSGPDEVGMEHVRLQQTVNGVGVRGGELTVHLKAGAVVSVLAKTVPGVDAVDTTPTVSAADALATARQSVAKRRGVTTAKLEEPRLEIVNPGALSNGLSASHLAWFVEARDAALRDFVWIDAHTGSELLYLDQLTRARDRLIYDANDTSTLPGTLVRTEGGAALGDVDADDAYDFSGDTYDYYSSEHARDSYNDAGASLISTVHYCEPPCPYANAFWDGTQMVYGEGFSAADDVAGHELTHAVTEYSAGLVYCLESGALNESFSDIFGETVDLGNGAGSDTPADRWLLGEDVPVFGAIRHMMDPNLYSQPSRVTDPQYFCASSCFDYDNGGVHINSGVPNHAYALMVDGGTFNGFTVSGIGLTKAGKIEYRALSVYLTSTATLLDDYNALAQSCTDLIGVVGITAADCLEVGKALDAVEMGGPVCAICGDGQLDAGEQCDDGNPVAADGCESDCTISPNCQTVASTDVPKPITDFATTTSTVSVAIPGPITSVQVRGLQGTHTFPGDLEFHLTNPSAVDATLLAYACGGPDDFDLGFADSAGTPPSCPLTDGGVHQPATPLAPLAAASPIGTWTLSVNDAAGGDTGSLEAWSLLLCTPQCGNGITEVGEACDDGNGTPGDGCENDCTLTPGCQFVAATDVPQAIPDLGSVTSSVTIASTGTVKTVQILGLRGTHTYVGDLEFHLTGPALTDTIPVDNVCGGPDDFDLSLSDGASTPIPCPPTDGGTHLPTQPFTAHLGTPAGGTWNLTVYDLAGDDVGTLQGWGLLVCTSVCGDGNLEPGEECDDGNLTPNDGCSPTCQTGCAAAPNPACRTPFLGGKASIAITDVADAKDQLQWKWLAGTATTKAELGDPLGSDDYRLCLYDGGGLLATLKAPAGGFCAGKPCWKDKPKGYQYKDKDGTPDGITQLQLSSGVDGKAKIQVKAKGVNIPMPSLVGLASPLTVQLEKDSGGVCWKASYGFPPASKNDGVQFKDKAD